MRRENLGTTGQDVPVIGLGTWQLEEDDRAEAIRALRRGLDLGATHVDTAELYGRGEVERMVGEAIAGRRDEVVLVSKVLPDHATRGGTISACEASLRRLRTDRLDGYLLHWPGAVALSETIAGFEALVAAGKIRWWGVSNFDERDLAEAVRLAGPGRIACNQVLYHLEQRSIEHAVVPFCREHGVAVVGYSPFGSGRFPTDSPALASVARRRGSTPRQIALAFLTREPDLFAIPKAAAAAKVEENTAAGDLVLEPEDVAEIDAAFPRGRRRPGVPTI